MFRHKTNFFPLVLFLSCLVVPSILFAKSYEGKVVNVISADTLIINIGGKEYKTTLDYIDAPEQGQNFYDEAKQFVEKLALDQKVKVCTSADLALNPQVITAEVYVPKKTDPLNRELVRAGLAWCKIENGEKSPYDITYSLAKKRKLGLWADANPQPPWEYRKIKTEQLRTAEENKRKAEEERQKNAELVRFVMTGKTPEVPKTQNNSNNDNQGKNGASTGKGDKISDVDLFAIHAWRTRSVDANQDSFIEVSFDYKSKEAGRHIFWRNDTVDCNCMVYNVNDVSTSIATEQKTLTSENDKMFIKIPTGKYSNPTGEKVFVKCSIQKNQLFLEAQDDCNIR